MKIEIKPISLPEEPYYVYELAYPQGFTDEEGNDLSGVTFYVGKGTVATRSDQPERVDMHEIITRAHLRKNRIALLDAKERAIYSIWQRDMVVQKRIVFSSFDKEEVAREESKRIKGYGSILANSQGNPEELRKRLEQLATLKTPRSPVDTNRLTRFSDGMDEWIEAFEAQFYDERGVAQAASGSVLLFEAIPLDNTD